MQVANNDNKKQALIIPVIWMHGEVFIIYTTSTKV